MSKHGRVIGFYAIAVLGTTPFGSLIVGWIADAFGARYGLVIASVGALAAGMLGYVSLARTQQHS